MSAAVEELDWFDEPVLVTPEREQRLYDWIGSYCQTVRDGWIANGEDVTTERAHEGLRLVAYSMMVPERDTWMPLGRALYVHLEMTMFPSSEVGQNPDGDAALTYRDALRTIKSATAAEWDWAVGNHLGFATEVVHARRLAMDLGAPAAPSASVPTALYRHFDSAGALLYVASRLTPMFAVTSTAAARSGRDSPTQ